MMRNKKVMVAAAILVIFHAVGLYGLVWGDDPAGFRKLTPLNLMLTIGLVLAFHRNWSRSFLVFAGVVLLTGFLAEIVGVHTNLLFGHYHYGQSLGFKLWQVPLVIAANWLLLVYVTGNLVQALALPWWARAGLGAGLMVGLDLLIEPVAAVLDFWTWEQHRIPAANYWGWLGVGLLLQLYFQRAGLATRNPLAGLVYGLQVFFFLALNALL
ncbi:MAG: carotenoid biosynthesis protein [Adhaeribacter sp.]